MSEATVFGAPLAGFVLLAAVTLLAGALQRLAGQGFGTILAGFTALVAPQHVPVAILLLGVVATMLGAGLDVSGIRWREIAPAVIGRFLGTIPAIWAVGYVAGSPLLGPSVAVVILIGVALSLVGLRVAKTDATLFVAGGLSGFMATLTSAGAAPIGLIYQNDQARAARGTLNLFFLTGLVFSVGGLVLDGRVTVENLGFAAALAPFAVLGVVGVAPFAGRLAAGSLRPAALGLAAFASFLLLLKAML